MSASTKTAGQLDVVFAEAVRGTEHEGHEGWTYKEPYNAIECLCGAEIIKPL
ncbi:hypothetical protein TIN2_54 [Tsukamurella phage TIN2]|uniref:Uncharacterized protein n=1 Tax=Tsukamurella phage TIN2 TaxID=1636545 RepID=A0A0K0N5F8_9CAUD|nr:hypothetical protein AVT55_gp069 [Tsukamurella phage TIN2]AKJ71744.1 hypothetical protein TIN2_54 [Tsukamurella phage TIN2]